MSFIVLPGLIDRQYAKFAARYGILGDSAIIFDELVDFVDFIDGRKEILENWTDGQKSFWETYGRTKLFREMYGRTNLLGNFGRTDRNSPQNLVKSTKIGKIGKLTRRINKSSILFSTFCQGCLLNRQ